MTDKYFILSICSTLYLPHLRVAFRFMSQIPNYILYLPLVKFYRAHFVLVATQLRLTELEEVRLQVFRSGISELELPRDRHRRLHLHIAEGIRKEDKIQR